MKRRVSEALLRDETTTIRNRAEEFGWTVSPEFDQLLLTVELTARDDEPYVIEFECTDYDQAPPRIEMLDPETREPGTPRAFFDDRGGSRSLLWQNGPGICHAFNRKFYLEIDQVHNDWNPQTISRWKDEAGFHRTISGFLLLVERRLHNDHYQGRFSE